MGKGIIKYTCKRKSSYTKTDFMKNQSNSKLLGSQKKKRNKTKQNNKAVPRLNQDNITSLKPANILQICVALLY